jgi:hypothetical protein
MPPGIQQVMTQLFCWSCNDALTDDNSSDLVTPMCQGCVDENMVWCEMCGEIGISGNSSLAYQAHQHNRRHGTEIPTESFFYCEDAGEWRCSGDSYHCDCGEVYAYEDNWSSCCNETSAVHNYGYSPAFMYYAPTMVDDKLDFTARSYYAKKGTLYMGVEIEVEKAYDLADNFLDKAKEDAENPRFLYLKSDGSLDHSGMEIVTMPATLESFMHMYPIDAIQWLRNMGARAWNRSRCGMHVHLARSAFTPSHLWKFIKFQVVNSQHCIAFAGRDSAQWASWGNSQMTELQSKPSIGVKHRGGYADWCNRYSAINLTGSRTIELRYFRPNLNDDGAYRVVQFVQAMYDYTKNMSYRDVVAGRWDFSLLVRMMAGDEKYQHAYNYIRSNYAELSE